MVLIQFNSIQFNSIQFNSIQFKLNKMNKPKLPKPTLKQFNNKFPHELCEVNTRDGVTKFIPRSAIDDEIWIDECICIDSELGIYARCLQVDTIFLERDHESPSVEFTEY